MSERTEDAVEVEGYALRLDRHYDPDTHMWVQPAGEGRMRVGLDALTADTYGSLAQLAFAPVGTPIDRGDPFGSLEAAKFVGPLTAPLSGLVVAANAEVLGDPDLVLHEPYDRGWLVEIDPTEFDNEVGLLVCGDLIPAWYARAIADHREKGLVAE
jgi:glycine cleavage system H protein